MILTATKRPDLFVLDADLRAEKEYWAERLSGRIGEAGAVAPVADRTVASPPGSGGKSWRRELPGDLADRLGHLSGASLFPLFTTLVAALAACLAQGKGQHRILLGSPSLAGDPEAAPNAVALVLELAPEISFRRLLIATRDVLREAYTHQRYPFSRLARELGLGSGEEDSPALRVVASLAGLHGPWPADLGADLVFAFSAAEGRMEVVVADRRGLYLPSTLGRFLARFTAGLAAALGDVARPLGEIDWLSPAERHQLKLEWSRGPRALVSRSPAPAPRLHELITARAAAAPEAVAVVDGKGCLSYRELTRRTALTAGLVARRLGPAAGRAEIRIGVLLERSADLVVALLAVLEAGAAYVPLDPALPAERLRFFLADSRADLLLTRSELSERAADDSVPRLCLDDLETGDDVEERAPAKVLPDHLAYLIYTSGSTGRPKGVMISHRGLVNYLLWAAEAYEVGAGDGAAVHSSIGFDLTVTSLWSPLVAGKTVRMLAGDTPEEALRTARDGAFSLSLAKITPAHLELLRATLPDLSLAAGARVWLLGGEALHAEQVAPWRQQTSGSRWINEYGPTETVVGCAVHEVGPSDPEQGPVPIGRPIAGTLLRLFGPGLAPVPIGERGELFVGGIGVARGYWNRPALTAERFVPDPGPSEAGARLYRTGDLAFHRPDGALVYLGRRDDQVKIRGYRVEPAEIEAALSRHPGVVAAAVAARRQRLVAYVVTAAGAEVGREPLRRWLAESLPEYMVPSTFVALPELPLTANGKVDRKALPAPKAGLGTGDGGEPEAFLSPFEEILAGIWADVLGREAVARHDDFFELGGHSLMAAQVIARLRRIVGIEAPLATFFEAPTLAAFAAAVESLEAVTAPDLPLGAVNRGGEIPLSFAQQRLWFLEHLRPGTAVGNLPLALAIVGPLRPAFLRRALGEIVHRHETLRTVFPRSSGEPVGRILPPSPLAVPLVDLSRLPSAAAEAEGRRLAVAEGRRPLDLDQGPLLRTTLLHFGPVAHTLVLVMHHIVSDGWSFRVLVRELATFYGAWAEGAPATLPELPCQYADFAAWQRRHFADGGLEKQRRYWLGRLAGLDAVAELPAQRSRPEVRSFRGALVEVELAGGLLPALKRLGRREGVTLFMTLLAALKVVVRHRTGEDRVVLGTDVAGRSAVETEGLIGFFVNQLVLVTDLGGDPSFRELLARVRETTLGAYAHQDLPFDRLVEALNPHRSLERTGLFQTKLIVQNLPQWTIEIPDLRFSPLTLDTGTAQLDLTLAFWEVGDGLRGWVNHSTDLFDEASVHSLCDAFETVLSEVAARPAARLSELDMTLSKIFKRSLRVSKNAVPKPSPFKKIKPRSVSLARSEELVATTTLGPEAPWPPVITPKVPEFDLPEWAANRRRQLEEQLVRDGALLFRGFGIDRPEVFERFAGAFCDELFNENGEHPRENVEGQVYTPVFYPPDKQLLWHNENSFNHRWPSKILFCCLQPPSVGGETPIVDSRRIFARIAPEIRDRFVGRGVQYVRTYGHGLGLGWQQVFQTTSKAEVENRCREEGFEFEWRGEDILRTRCRRPGAVLHPTTGDPVWFNQALHWHMSCLDAETRTSMLSLFAEDDLPRNCYYGDGSPIADADVAAILDAYRQLEVAFPWQRGDVLVLDNLLTAHGRNPFSGRRKILVALGDMKSYDDVTDPGSHQGSHHA